MRVSDTDSDLGSPSRGVRRNQVHTSASKYAATSCGYDCTVTVGKSAMAMPQSQSEVSFIDINYNVCDELSVLHAIVHVCTCMSLFCLKLPRQPELLGGHRHY